MTGIDVIGFQAPIDEIHDAEPAGSVRFLGSARPFWRLMIRGAALLPVTLGFYRFWLVTDLRRLLWVNTEIGGDVLEYTGTPGELLRGFVTAMAVLVPIYAVLLALTFGAGGYARWVGIVAVVILALLGQFARFRARGYRLTRTVFRGLRFHQTGSAGRCALGALFWWLMIAVTFGLAYPVGKASLERYKLRNTYYGNLRGRFEGSAARLLLRGLLLWLAVIGPLILGLIIVAKAVDWPVLAEAIAQGDTDVMDRLKAAGQGFAAAVVYASLAFGASAMAAAVLYPAFQGMVLRWWLSGLRFGELTVHSRLRSASVYAVYVRFLWYALSLVLVVIITAALAVVIDSALGERLGDFVLAEFLTAAIVVGIYVVTALAYSTIYQVVVRLGLWRLEFESIELSGLAMLDRVQAGEQRSSAIGEGLADALKVGGF